MCCITFNILIFVKSELTQNRSQTSVTFSLWTDWNSMQSWLASHRNCGQQSGTYHENIATLIINVHCLWRKWTFTMCTFVFVNLPHMSHAPWLSSQCSPVNNHAALQNPYSCIHELLFKFLKSSDYVTFRLWVVYYVRGKLWEYTNLHSHQTLLAKLRSHCCHF